MGYTTEFIGQLEISKPLDDSAVSAIGDLNKISFASENKEGKKLGQPESRCQWVVAPDKKHIVWDGNEKFYYYMEWLEYIVRNILEPKGYMVSGELMAEGEDVQNDVSKITVKNNKISRNVFSANEIAGYEQEKEAKAKNQVGEIIATAFTRSRPLYKWIHASMSELENHKFLGRDLSQMLLLIKEMDGSFNLYNLSDESLKNGRFNYRRLVDDRRRGFSLPVSKISKIIHCNSFLYRKIFQSNKVYCFYNEWQSFPVKEVFIFQDDSIIREIIKLMPSENSKFKFRRSNDLKFAKLFIKKGFKTIVKWMAYPVAVIFLSLFITAFFRESTPYLFLAVALVWALILFKFKNRFTPSNDFEFSPINLF